LGANLLAPFFLTNFRIMEKEEENKNKTPHRMSRIAFPKAKYGVFLAVIIIVIANLIYYKDFIISLIK
tara:strand:- start:279 stop:482 length:204 start_codon:yes stop_codon:yes gene_type:complete